MQYLQVGRFPQSSQDVFLIVKSAAVRPLPLQQSTASRAMQLHALLLQDQRLSDFVPVSSLHL